MAVSLFPGEFDDLERELFRLADDITFPPTPSLAFPVPQSKRRVRQLIPGGWWKAGRAAAVLLLAATLSVPEARHALAGWLDFPGIRIEIGDRAGDPPPTVTTIGGSLLLGEAATLEGASSAVEFELVAPGAGLEGTEPEVYLNHFDGAPVVSLLYAAWNELPEIGDTGVGMLLMQIDASGNTSSSLPSGPAPNRRPSRSRSTEPQACGSRAAC